MGIRGASSLLSTDRRRFGRPWVLSEATCTVLQTGDDCERDRSAGETTAAQYSESSRVIVYIDGPALLYHLIRHASDADAVSTPPSPTGSPRRLPPCRDPTSSSIKPAFGVLSPSTVSTLARSFVIALLDAGADEVHLVVEGLADESKEAEQVDRMSDRAALCDVAAREILSGGGRVDGRRQIWRKVPHPFAERAMIEGVESLIDDLDSSYGVVGQGDGTSGCDGSVASGNCQCHRRPGRRVFVHRATGEAEAEICSLIVERRDLEEEEEVNQDPRSSTVVFSNDTDFLVHEFSPGYVPLDSIEFFESSSSLDDNYCSFEDCDRLPSTTIRIGVRGWFYERSKFASSLNLQSEQLPVLAALAGCDRVPPTLQLRRRIEAARKNVLQDENSGLRSRDRSNPSAKSCLVACARFVSHHGRTRGGGGCRVGHGKEWGSTVADEHWGEDDGGWLSRVAWAACGEGDAGRRDRFDELLSALRYVASSYRVDGNGRDSFSSTSTGNDRGRVATMSVPLRRLLERRVLYCIPLVETYETRPRRGGGVGDGRSKHRRGGSTKTKKKQLKLNRCRGKRDRERGGSCIRGVGDGVAGPSSLSEDNTETSSPQSPSAWMHPPFVELRKRLYSLVGLSHAATMKEGQDGRLFEVREYCRGGGGEFAMREFDVFGYVARCDEGAPSSSLADRFERAIAAPSPSDGTGDDFAAAAVAVDDDATHADRVRLYWEALEYCLSWRRGSTVAVAGDGGDMNDEDDDERRIISVMNGLPTTSRHLRRIYLAGLLLPPRAALLLSCGCLFGNGDFGHQDAERCSRWHHRGGNGDDGTTSVGRSLLRRVALIQVALFHVDLLVEFLSIALLWRPSGDCRGPRCDDSLPMTISRYPVGADLGGLDDGLRAVACSAAIGDSSVVAAGDLELVVRDADGDTIDTDVNAVDPGTLRDLLRRAIVASDVTRADELLIDLDSAGALWTAWGYCAAQNGRTVMPVVTDSEGRDV